MANWKKGTGGGSGAPEDFGGNWKEREHLELFSNYSRYGKCDYLAYILMYDQKAGYIIDAINDPAPPESTMENGTGGEVQNKGDQQGSTTSPPKQSKAEARMAKHVESLTKVLGTVVSEAVDPLIQAIKGTTTGNSNGEQDEGSDNAASASRSMNTYQQETRMMHTMTLLNKLQEQAAMVQRSIDEEEDNCNDRDIQRKRKRLKTLNATIDKVYGNLETHLEEDG